MTTPDYILRFMSAVFPDAPDLALASFNEKHAIVTATQTIVELREALLQCRSKLALAAESAAGQLAHAAAAGRVADELRAQRDELLVALARIEHTHIDEPDDVTRLRVAEHRDKINNSAISYIDKLHADLNELIATASAALARCKEE